MTDKETRSMIENGFKTGAIESPETVMRERIRLKITPRIVYELFREAYQRYEERKKHVQKGGSYKTIMRG